MICVVPNHNLTKNLNKTELSNYYENHEILNSIPKNTKILNLNLDNLTIDEIKVIARRNGENVFDLYLVQSLLQVVQNANSNNYEVLCLMNQYLKMNYNLVFNISQSMVVKVYQMITQFVDRKIKINNLDERVDLGTDLIRL